MLLAALTGNNAQPASGGDPPSATPSAIVAGESFGRTPPVTAASFVPAAADPEPAPASGASNTVNFEPIKAALREFTQNWYVEISPLGDKAYEFQLKTWVMRSGGEGEAMMILKRRAEKMRRELGASTYRIQDYQSGIQSTYPTTQRFVYAIVEFDAGR
jgi:hypothetical protein